MTVVFPNGLQQINVMGFDHAVTGFPKIFLAGFNLFVIYRIDLFHRNLFAVAEFVYQLGGCHTARVAKNT